MPKILTSKKLAFLMLMSLTQLLFAHGGVSMDDDVCILQIGEYRAHFTGYQPKLRATQEFCEDIPEVDSSIFVIDFIDNELRKMLVSFRIIKDVNEIGNNAKLSDLGGSGKIEAATIYTSPSTVHPTGTLNFTHQFSEPGRFIGIFTVHPEGAVEPIVSVFPFSVGVKNYTRYYVVILLVVLVTLVGYGLSSRFYLRGGKTRG